MKRLEHGRYVRAAAWRPHCVAQVFTIKGYLEEAPDVVLDAHIQLALLNNRALVSTSFVPLVFFSDMEIAKVQMEEAMAVAHTAIVLAPGDLVEVDGHAYRVSFVTNQDGLSQPTVADPIHFVEVK